MTTPPHPTFCTCPLVASLTDDERRQLWQLARPLRGADRGDLLRGPSQSPFCGLLLEGQAQVSHLTADGDEQPLALLNPGDLWGLGEALLHWPHAQVTALTACQALDLAVSDWNRLAPTTLARLWAAAARLLAAKNRTLTERVTQLSAHSLREKILLLRQALGDAPLSQSTMAQWLACDRSALSRELNRMRREGLIE